MSYWDRAKASKPIDIPQKSFYAKPVVHQQEVSGGLNPNVVNAFNALPEDVQLQRLKEANSKYDKVAQLDVGMLFAKYQQLSEEYQKLAKAYKKLKKDRKVVNKPKDLKIKYEDAASDEEFEVKN